MRKNNRKNKMNTAKLGVIFIVTAMALAGVGTGYSAWFDTITVHGTVSTGDVDINVVDYSGTYVWKVYGEGAPDNEIVVWHGFVSDASRPTKVSLEAQYSGCTAELISSAWAEQTFTGGVLIDDAITVTYTNLFPCIDFKVDYLFQYDGSIPAKIQVTDPEFTGDDADFFNTLIWTLPDEYPNMGFCYGEMWTCDEYGSVIDNIADLEGYQIHEDDYILLVITLHLAQNNELMNMDASFTAEIEVVQWNEYPYEGGECGEEPFIGHHADVALCLDTSGSVSGSPLADLKLASKAFVNVLVNDDGMVAIAGFNENGYPVIALTDDQAALDTAIDGLTAGGTTNPGAGISIAQEYLDNEPTAPDDRTDDSTYPDFMVIITDGNPVPAGDAPHIAAAQDAKDAGTKIYVLGIGSVDETFCHALSSGNGYYFTMANYGDLQNILLGLVLL